MAIHVIMMTVVVRGAIMRRICRVEILLSWLIIGAILVCISNTYGGDSKNENETYAVVKISEISGVLSGESGVTDECKAVAKSEVNSLKKEVADFNKNAIKEYKDKHKKSQNSAEDKAFFRQVQAHALKSGVLVMGLDDEPDKDQPDKKILTVLKSDFTSLEDANKFADLKNQERHGIKYDVISVGDDISAVDHDTMKDLMKTSDEDYKQTLKEYQDAKKNKNKLGGNELKKPDKRDYIVKTLKSNFKSIEEAEKFVDEQKLEREKGGGKKTSVK